MSASTFEAGDASRRGSLIPGAPSRSNPDKALFVLKGLAIVGVVFHHVGNRRFSAEMNTAISVLPVLFTWCVLLFFAVAGWLHSLAEERRPRSFGAFIRIRARRLLIPYAALVLLYALIW